MLDYNPLNDFCIDISDKLCPLLICCNSLFMHTHHHRNQTHSGRSSMAENLVKRKKGNCVVEQGTQPRG